MNGQSSRENLRAKHEPGIIGAEGVGKIAAIHQLLELRERGLAPVDFDAHEFAIGATTDAAVAQADFVVLAACFIGDSQGVASDAGGIAHDGGEGFGHRSLEGAVWVERR